MIIGRKMENIYLIVLFAVLFLLICVLFKEINKQNKAKLKLDKSLDKQLLIMLGNDRQAALRLLRNARKNNPGRSYLWYHEKVIKDLERDRRY